MEIVAVNIAVRQLLDVKGTAVQTGIFKSPTTGPQKVGIFGLESDTRVDARKQFGEANHAIYLYPYEHYDYWQQFLGRGPLACGQFGENLTTQGILETEIRMGDVLRAGSVVMQVAHPRLPCRKLNACLEQNFARQFLDSRRVGFYLRVLETGTLQAGDKIECIDRDPGSPTVDEFVRVSQIDYWDADGLEALLRTKDLIPQWRTILEEKRDRARTADGWFGTRELQVVQVHDEGDGMVSYVLRCAQGRALPALSGGQWLLVVPPGSSAQGGARVMCHLSGQPAAPDDGATKDGAGRSEREPLYRITLQRDLLPRMACGDRLRAAAPRGSFKLSKLAPDCDRLLCLTQGAGLAPVACLLAQWDRGPAAPPVVLLHRTEGSPSAPTPHHLWAELSALARRRQTVQLIPLPARSAIDASVDDLVACAIPHITPRTDLLIAGTQAFVTSLQAQLLSVGPGLQHLHVEVIPDPPGIPVALPEHQGVQDAAAQP